MIRLRPIALLLIFATACGLTDDERDETDKYAYVTFSDAAFERFCLERYDTDNDGRVSPLRSPRGRHDGLRRPGYPLAQRASRLL